MSSTPEPTLDDVAGYAAILADPNADADAREGATTRLRILLADQAPQFVARLAAAMSEAGEVTKSSTNTEQGYKFASAEAILGAVRRPLLERGIILKAQPRSYEESEITARSGAKGTRVVIAVDFTFLADDGELTIEGWRGEGQDYGDKAYGKAYTNAIKTLIRIEWMLPTEHDDPEGSPAGERVSSDAPAELPAWAAENGGATRTNFAHLDEVVGRDLAFTVAAAIRDKCGGTLPAIAAFAVGTAVLTVVGELDPLAIEDAKAKRAAKAAAADQDAAAEAPDTPPAEEAPAPEDEEANARDAAEAAGIDTSDLDDAPPEDPPAPGSVPNPEELDLGNPVQAITAIRDAGCICEDPLGAWKQAHGQKVDGAVKTNNACPLAGHGIAF